ncbi:class I SAM-dependent methyltransferase [Angustibacter sp. McL0619]|uniref:class I SAM-dependent methyltransferase n=1 Tax=Angustibacter sp. McL0619 TaxID=3415676 RepID=UPI003CF2FBA8
MTTAQTSAAEGTQYALGRTRQEYERLRRQAQQWEGATERVLDRVGLPLGARCLDAGCGPGETMRQLAQRVGPRGRVVGIDVDETLGGLAVDRLQRDGHQQCSFVAHDLVEGGPILEGPFDLVYARLLLFHLPSRVEVLARLWDAVAPGGYLVVQDYDMSAVGAAPPLAGADRVGELIIRSFGAAGCEIRVGSLLPRLFIEAGVGVPDGTDVSGRLERLADASLMLEAVLRSLLPLAVSRQIVTEPDAESLLVELRREAVADPEHPVLWPLLMGAWRRKA